MIPGTTGDRLLFGFALGWVLYDVAHGRFGVLDALVTALLILAAVLLTAQWRAMRQLERLRRLPRRESGSTDGFDR